MATESVREPPAAPSLSVNVRRVVALTTVCGFVEVIGFRDAGGIYPAIMTGNTVQLGWSLAQGAGARFALLAFAIGAFFLGCLVASLIRRHLKRPALELCIMAALLVVADFVRCHPALRMPVELPVLALALGMQGETVSRFGAVSLQTLVVTNNIVKCCDAFVGRYLGGRRAKAPRPALAEVLLPGLAWLTYSLSAAVGAIVSEWVAMPLIVPALILVLVTVDLIRMPDR